MQTGTRPRLKLHIDTDIGGDPDDLCALAMVLHWPDAELTGVTTVCEHAGKRAGYACYALSLAGRGDVDVAAGADVADFHYSYFPALPPEERYWPEPVAPAPTPLDSALDLLARSIEQDATIVAIGPLTNLALLERRAPGTLRRARLFIMGGFSAPTPPGYPHYSAHDDTNLQLDVESSLFVLEHSNPTLVPLAVTVQTSLRREHLPALRAADPLARLIAHQAECYGEDEGKERKYGVLNIHHDPLTCAIALGWREGVQIEEVMVKSEVWNGYLIQEASSHGQRMNVVTHIDGVAFEERWLRTVCAKPGSSQ